MNVEVLTPITQAMKEGVITRRQLKDLMRRSNFYGLLHLALFLCVLILTGSIVWVAMGTWWIIPAMFLHGIVVVHHFSQQHECSHYTPFRSRWLNEVIGHYCGFIMVIPNKFFRYEHCDHHTYTNLYGRDPELIELPISLGNYLSFVSGYPYWKQKFGDLFRHTFGHLSEAEKQFVPKEEHSAIIVEARCVLALYIGLIGISWIMDIWVALWFWWIPMFISEPVMRAIRMTEHVGRPNIANLRENTRTNLVSLPMRFLCWNMNYHAEHHYASSVPFHALPKLHRMLKGYVYVEERGYLGAHIDIFTQMFQKRNRENRVSDTAV